MMNRTCTLLMTGALATMALSSTKALADDYPCPPAYGNVTLDGNVLATGNCSLNGTTVKGNVQLYDSSTLFARGIFVDGNIQTQTDNVFEVDVADSRIDGNIQLDGLLGAESEIVNNQVDGDIQLDNNRPRIEVLNNDVGGNIQAFENRGLVVIAGNTVDGNLQCKENSPAPAGGNNVVHGNKEDQCANLLPPADNGGDAGTTANVSGGAPGAGGSGAFGPLTLLWMLLAAPPLLARRLR